MTARVVYPEPAVAPGASSGPARASRAEVDRTAALGAFGLLTRLWCRPTAEEVACWDGVAELEEQLRQVLPARRGLLSPLVEPDAMLDEYERLFVGPGPVPCCPYESFWRMDVPVDIRRSLMGPCTTELRRLYAALGLEIGPSSGELPDHLVVELEAVTYALSTGGADEIARALISDHLRTWLPRLCRAVRHEAEHPFYRALAGTTLDWLQPLGRFVESVPSVPSVSAIDASGS